MIFNRFRKTAKPEDQPAKDVQATPPEQPEPADAQPEQPEALEAQPEVLEAQLEPAEDLPKKGWLTRLKSGLGKSSGKLTTGITDLFTKRKLDQEAVDELEELLILSDMGVSTAADMAASIAKSRFGKDVDDNEIKTALAEEIEQHLAPVAKPLEIDKTKNPYVILMVGVNGSGKTTTIGKMARQFVDRGLKVRLAAGDTFRAAAVEQLKVWGDRTGCPVVCRDQGADAAGLVFDAIATSKKEGDDVLMIDTAGRLQNKDYLMDELKKIVRVIKKQMPGAPHSCLLVLDATIGQNAHSQTQAFLDMTDVTGLVVTKLDGTAKGGVLVALADKFALPVHYIGVGEQAADLQPFTARDYARSMLDI